MVRGQSMVKYNEKIKAGCHPYDKTVRPQFVKKSQNINYYSDWKYDILYA